MEDIQSDTGNFDLKQAEEKAGIAQEQAKAQNAAPSGNAAPSPSAAGTSGAVAPEKPVSSDASSIAAAGVAAVSPEVGMALMVAQDLYTSAKPVIKSFQDRIAANKPKIQASFGPFLIKADSRKQERQENAREAKPNSKNSLSRFTASADLQKRCANDDFSAAFQTARQSVGEPAKGMNITPRNADMYSLSLKNSLDQIRKRRAEGPQVIEDAELQKEEVYNSAQKGTDFLQERLREHASTAKLTQPSTPSS